MRLRRHSRRSRLQVQRRQNKTEARPSGVKGPGRPKLQGKSLNYKIEPLESGLKIRTLSGEVFLVELVCRGCKVKVEDTAMKVNLVLFELDELDVILEIDFLAKYHAVLNYSNKEVILRDLGDKFVIVFIGNILVYFPNVERHVEQLRVLLQTLKEERLFAKFSYYRRFMEGFSKLALPLKMLTRKAIKLEWSHDCEKSFQELKGRLTTTPVLALPTLGNGNEVFCNASHQGLGCVLM
ncbi:Retrovirus-related Pol polyprotein from transposon 17.6 [Cucumis melo var. makuwa]|uniref:Retrovirus-related Pol polyprotein from transposon 17.6 n=1 Tax=Cucumis melo var. makuwa TaxID=1194695 RepID=A0A5A7V504_CUCMM|nr:Retrovirus-related Pol polyprotein from transposon 17.6 [Cucumis melo var. makuwa]